MMGWSPRCYIPSFVEIGLLVPEKIFEGFLPYVGVAAILVMWPASSIMSSDFHFLVPESFHKKFGSDRQGSFWENPNWIFVCTRPWAKVKKWPWPSILNYLHKFNKMSAPTNFQVTGCNSFWKIHYFHFFLLKSPSYKIWPCRKIGKGQPSVIIWTNHDGLESLMLHTKFRGNRSTGAGEDFWRVFTIYGHGGHLGHVTHMPRTKFRSPY